MCHVVIKVRTPSQALSQRKALASTGMGIVGHNPLEQTA